MSALRETARQRRRRIAAEEERWADEAYEEYRETEEGSQVCRWILVPAQSPTSDYRQED
jgi:hypothetical protein